MEYREHSAPPEVARWVRCVWTLRGGAPSANAPEPALPDGSPELIFNLADPFEHVSASGRVTRQPQAFLVGQITAPMVVRPTGRVDLIAMRLEAHGASYLVDDASALTDCWVDLRKLRDRAIPALLQQVRTVDMERRTGLIKDWLVERAGRTPAGDTRVEQAVTAIRSSHGAVNLDDLSRQLDLTPRSLQRRFKLRVGISPKQLARIVRFQRIFAAWREDPSTLSRVAVECGYFDQPHMIRDFRQFAGAPPAGFLAALPTCTGFFVGSGKREAGEVRGKR